MNNRLLKFTGSHFEIGKQVGQQYLLWGKRDVVVGSFSNEVYNQQLKIYQQFFPNYLDFLKGVATAMNLAPDKILKSYLTGFLDKSLRVKNTCSEIILNNKNAVLVASNYDWRVASEAHAKLISYNFTNGLTNDYMALSDMGTWQVGAKADISKFLIIIGEAWNRAGLYIGLNGAPGNERQVGMSPVHVIQAVIEQCQTTAEALKLIAKIPLSEAKTFIVADKHGQLAIAERSLLGGLKIRKSKQHLIATNHYQHQDLLKENLSIFEQIPFHSTFARYQYLATNLQVNAKPTAKELLVLFSKPPVLQNWRSVDNGDAITIWTLVLDLSNNKFNLIFSPLNRKYYQSYDQTNIL